MANQPSLPKKPGAALKRLNFLAGSWHTSGEILKNADQPSATIRGMDTYEWINDGFHLLHRVDVMMGDTRTEALEIIGYDAEKRSYFLTSFDNMGETTTMYAQIPKPGVLAITDKLMRSTLTVGKTGKNMTAKWERSDDGKKWMPWMTMEFSR